MCEEDLYFGLGIVFVVIFNCILYCYNLVGLSMLVDIVCFLVMVVINFVCYSLWCGEFLILIVGGVNMMFYLGILIMFFKVNMMFKDSLLKVFDFWVNGYIWGEGVGVVILKCLFDVVVDGEWVYVFICGMVLN